VKWLKYHLSPLGDQAIVIELGSDLTMEIHRKVKALTSFFEHCQPEWLLDYTPAFTSVTLFYDSFFINKNYGAQMLPYQFVSSFLQTNLLNLLKEVTHEHRLIEIPVCYGGELGPDLSFVSNYNNLTTEEVIHIHATGDYIVYMIGFAPGFPYLGGMSEHISTPRKATPRLTIPPRSVGIGGKQTGIYPIETPGGWQIIGQTPLELFRPNENPPTLLRAGDYIRFIPISYEEFLNWEG